MQFMIEGGRWIVQSDDRAVHIRIRPRRSAHGEATELALRADPMPLMTLQPERFAAAESPMAWVWDGTPENARKIVVSILEALKDHLSPERASSDASQRWRTKVLTSLFRPAPVSPGEARSKRA